MDVDTPKKFTLRSSNEVEEISKNLATVSESLQKQVRNQHEVLFDQAIQAGRLEGTLDTLSDKMCHIRSFVYKLKNHVDYQYNMILDHTTNASRIHTLLNTLLISRAILDFARELKFSEDPVAQAKIHRKINETFIEEEIVQIHTIQDEWSLIKTNRRKIKKLTQMDLLSCLQERKEMQVVNCLKVLLDLKDIDDVVTNLISNYIKELEASLTECLTGSEVTTNRKETKKSISAELKSKNPTTAFRPGKPSLIATSQNIRANLGKSLNKLFNEDLYECCQQIFVLQRGLKSLTRKGLNKTLDVHCLFWPQCQQLFQTNFSNSSLPVFQVLQEDYPKLRKEMNDFEDRCGKAFTFDREIFSLLEKNYIDTIAATFELCFEDNFNKETLDIFFKTTAVKLEDAAEDVVLCLKVIELFAQYGKKFCSHLKDKINYECITLADTPSSEQANNTCIANLLTYYKTIAKKCLSSLSNASNKSITIQEHIQSTIQEAEQLIRSIVQNVMESIYRNANKIILKMHREKSLSLSSTALNGPSMYSRELQEYLDRSWNIHITPFEDKDIVGECGSNLAKRCIRRFIQNISFVRPISETGRSKLKDDCLLLEKTLNPICSNIFDIGDSFRILHKMSELIIQSPTELAEEGLNQDAIVPRYIVLFLLFGHAGSDLPSPHITAGWSCEQFINWLDSHEVERDILKLISSAIYRYRESTRLKKTDKYDPVYPLIMNLIEFSNS